MVEQPDPQKSVVGSGKRPTKTAAGGCRMGSLGPTHLTLLLGAVILATAVGLVGSAVARRRKRRARRYFLLGFTCGFIAGVILQRRRRVLNGLQAVAAKLPRRMVT